ncbi:hypothetical protein STEG23_015728 [Scotinomys teguina]
MQTWTRNATVLPTVMVMDKSTIDIKSTGILRKEIAVPYSKTHFIGIDPAIMKDLYVFITVKNKQGKRNTDSFIQNLQFASDEDLYLLGNLNDEWRGKTNLGQCMQSELSNSLKVSNEAESKISGFGRIYQESSIVTREAPGNGTLDSSNFGVRAPPLGSTVLTLPGPWILAGAGSFHPCEFLMSLHFKKWLQAFHQEMDGDGQETADWDKYPAKEFDFLVSKEVQQWSRENTVGPALYAQKPQNVQVSSLASICEVQPLPCGFTPHAPTSETRVAKAVDKGEYQGHLSVLYALSQFKFTCVHLPIGASEEPPPTHTLLKKKQVKQKAESLTTQLKIMASQWNELRDHLILGTEGSLDYRTRPYHRPNCFYEKVKMEHKQVMSDLQRLKNDNRDASEKFRELTEEKGFYWVLASLLLQ